MQQNRIFARKNAKFLPKTPKNARNDIGYCKNADFLKMPKKIAKKTHI
jgi:hypothetical protein